MRHVQPAARHAGHGDFLDARERQVLDRAKGGEVHRRHLRQAHDTARARRLGEPFLHVALHVFLQDAPLRTAALELRESDAQLTRELPHRGPRVGGLRTGALTLRGRTARQMALFFEQPGNGEPGIAFGHVHCGSGSGHGRSNGDRSGRLGRSGGHYGNGRGRRSSNHRLIGPQDRDPLTRSHLRAHAHIHRHDDARGRRRHLHRCLIAFQHEKRGSLGHPVPRAHSDLDHLDAGGTTQIRHQHIDQPGITSHKRQRNRRCGTTLCGTGRCGSSARRLRVGRRSSQCDRHHGGGGCRRRRRRRIRHDHGILRNLKHKDGIALLYPVTDLQAELTHGAREGRGDFHRGLVGFERDQRLLGRNRLAHRHGELDHFDFGGAAQVGYGDGLQFHVHSRARGALLHGRRVGFFGIDAVLRDRVGDHFGLDPAFISQRFQRGHHHEMAIDLEEVS